MGKRAYVKNMGPSVGAHVIRVECGGRHIDLAPNMLTEVSEEEALVIQYNYAHMGVHHVSLEAAKTCGIPIAEFPTDTPPAPTALPEPEAMPPLEPVAEPVAEAEVAPEPEEPKATAKTAGGSKKKK